MLQARLYLHSGSILPPVPDFGQHLVNTCLRTGVPCSPESDAPRSFSLCARAARAVTMSTNLCERWLCCSQEMHVVYYNVPPIVSAAFLNF